MMELISKIMQDMMSLGYIGIIAIMALESTCFPIIVPSEVFLVSFGAAAYVGDMNIYIVIATATVGVLIGCLINYYMAAYLGRSILYKYGKYILLDKEKLEKWEHNFDKYNKYIVFFGRFIPIPAVKHIVSLPAGLTRMNIKHFTILSVIGGFIFSTGVVMIGFWYGKKSGIENYDDLISKMVIYTFAFIAIMYALYKLADITWTYIQKRKIS
jgi:membrane protein DedA with SNARE-associated domain